MSFDLDELSWARELVGHWVPPTPAYAWPLLAECVGGKVVVKHENHTPTGAFKVRGGLVFATRLRDEHPEVAGIISATRGNHGQSLAFAGRATGLAVTIVVPEHNSASKNASMRGFGAELIVHGADYQAAREHADWLATQRGLQTVPPFHRDLVLGVATAHAELFDAFPDLDALYVPVGMGTGIAAAIEVRDLLGLRTEIIGVVTENAPATALSFDAGHVVTTPTAMTFVDGVACRTPVDEAIEVMCKGATRIVIVSEDEAAVAMRTLYNTTHNVAEPAGALALAGVLKERDLAPGRCTAIIQTGGNVDAAMLATVLEGHTPAP